MPLTLAIDGTRLCGADTRVCRAETRLGVFGRHFRIGGFLLAGCILKKTSRHDCRDGRHECPRHQAANVSLLAGVPQSGLSSRIALAKGPKSGDTLKYVKATTNVTLSLPEALLHKFRSYAATRNQSMTSLAAQAIKDLMERDQQYDAAKRRFMERIRNAPDRGTGGKISWTRDEIHER